MEQHAEQHVEQLGERFVEQPVEQRESGLPPLSGGGEVWFAALPDGEVARAAAHLLRHRAARRVDHHSGRPWLLGDWPDGYVTVAAAGARRLAVVGRCPATANALSVRLGRVRGVNDVEAAFGGLTGSFHLVASVGGRVRARGSASGVRRIFHARVAGVTVAAATSAGLAAAIEAGVDEETLALHLLSSPPPYPLDHRSVWRGVHGLRPHDCLVIEADGRARALRWWHPPEPELPRVRGAPAVRRELTAAVASCMADDGTVSADLSGGTDSTSLCFLAARRCRSDRGKLVTLHWEALDPANDDPVWARRAAARLPGAQHVMPSRDDCPGWYGGLTDPGDLSAPAPTPVSASTFPATFPATDEPGVWVRDRARFALLAELMTGRGSRLHMTGGGGDELFTALPPYLHDYVRSAPLAALARIRGQWRFRRWPLWPVLRALTDRGPFDRWLAASAGRLTVSAPGSYAVGRYVPSMAWGPDLRLPPWATPDAARAVRDLLREAAEDAEPLARQRGQHAALASIRAGGYGVRLLGQVTSRLGLEYAAPYLDDGVIEAALSVRVAERTGPGRHKPVLADAMRGIVPQEILERSTKGEYSAEFHAGFGRNRALLLELFGDARLARTGLVDPAALRASLLAPDPAVGFVRSLDPTLGCEMWLRSPPRTAVDHRAAVDTASTSTSASASASTGIGIDRHRRAP
ncbi:asparagine synthase [Streptomyces griseocarneus]|nr:asparagine synthase [Streptomyces griseocarneus]